VPAPPPRIDQPGGAAPDPAPQGVAPVARHPGAGAAMDEPTRKPSPRSATIGAPQPAGLPREASAQPAEAAPIIAPALEAQPQADARPTAGLDPRQQTEIPAAPRIDAAPDASLAAPIEAAARPAEPGAAEPPRAPPPSAPARQVVPAVVAVAIGGAGRITVMLEPGELGRVEISVERQGEAAQVVILAERPETLALLQRDQRELDRALTHAGLQAEGRALSFGLSGGDGGSGQPHRRRDAPGNDSAARGVQSPDATTPPPRRIAVSLLDLAI
jgi:Meckel syndrome type 1 protein